MRDFLLEIGVEEIPATHLEPAADFIRSSFAKLMQDSVLAYSLLQVSYTPRRFYLLAAAVQEVQADVRVNKTGPAKKIALDEAGNLLPAGMGFLKKNNAEQKDIYIETTAKGEFIALNQLQQGKVTVELLIDWITELLPRIPFAKTMIWNESRLSFSRPLRWLCGLWGADVIPLSIACIQSGNISFGNRYLGLDIPLEIKNPQSYLTTLKEQSVLADRTERRAMLVHELATVLEGSALGVLPDERLIDTVTDLVEIPIAMVAEFNLEFLILPEKIITSTISQHQKYFSVQDASGKLSNTFVFISNGNRKYAQLIRRGNEKVVTARLADAMWYYKEDTHMPLESYLPRLEDVVFQSKLGTMAAKSKRIQQIAEYLCSELDFNNDDRSSALRTALLCKADLVTTMLGEKEFAKLQGYIGKQYALASGETAEVAEGIYEHYMPRGNNDGLPKTLSGAITAVADKLDSVCGIIGIGLLPTGSADPFALRRAANGVVQIIMDRGWSLNFSQLLDFVFASTLTGIDLKDDARSDVQTFFRQRVEWFLKQDGIEYDVIDSVMHLGLGDLTDLKQRAVALQNFKYREDFLRLVIGFKRAANIISARTDFPAIQPALFAAEEENELNTSLNKLRQDIDTDLKDSDYSSAIAQLVEFGVHIDRFFNAVLVNCEELELRNNRHALLYAIKQEFLRIADISRIVIENETPENK